MTDVLRAVLADLAAEGELLDTLVADLDEPGWRTPSPAAGWDVADYVLAPFTSDEDAKLDTIVDEAAATEFESRVHEAVAQGARLLAGNLRRGALYAPTVLDSMRTNSLERVKKNSRWRYSRPREVVEREFRRWYGA